MERLEVDYFKQGEPVFNKTSTIGIVLVTLIITGALVKNCASGSDLNEDTSISIIPPK